MSNPCVDEGDTIAVALGVERNEEVLYAESQGKNTFEVGGCYQLF